MAVATYLHRQQAQKYADEEQAGKRTGDDDGEVQVFVMLQILLCFFCPPLAVWLERGVDVDFIISLALSCILWLPGAIYALYIVRKYETAPITTLYPALPMTHPRPKKDKLTVEEMMAPAAREPVEYQYPPSRVQAEMREREKEEGLERLPSYRSRASRKTLPPDYPSDSSSSDEDPSQRLSQVQRGKQRAYSSEDDQSDEEQDWEGQSRRQLRSGR